MRMRWQGGVGVKDGATEWGGGKLGLEWNEQRVEGQGGAKAQRRKKFQDWSGAQGWDTRPG